MVCQESVVVGLQPGPPSILYPILVPWMLQDRAPQIRIQMKTLIGTLNEILETFLCT